MASPGVTERADAKAAVATPGHNASPSAPDAPATPLFRPQVLAERQSQWLGTVMLRPRAAHRWSAWFALAAALGLLAMLFFASYAKKAHVRGWLVPDQGMARVYPAHAAEVIKVMAREGQAVRKGQPLMILSTEQQSTALGNTQAGVARALAVRRDSLADEARQHQQLLAQQDAALRARLAALSSEQDQLREEIGLQQARVGLAHTSELRQQALRRRGFISDQHLQTSTEGALEQAAKLRSLRRTQANLDRERLTLEGDLRDLPLKLQAQAGNLARSRAQVEQELAHTEALREVVVSAPQDGIVTAIQAEAGGGVSPALPLLSIVPAGGQLEAHLYAPSRAIGFVRAGQRVRLRYQAYPYQKFGHHEGIIVSVSRSAFSAAELPAQVASLTGGGAQGSAEPVYRIIVRLARQHVTAYGKPVPLQAGMQLDADVVLERRRLIDWVLDPLYTLTGKLDG